MEISGKTQLGYSVLRCMQNMSS